MTAPRGTSRPVAPVAPVAPVVTHEAASAFAAAILADAPTDPRVAALCRWAIHANVAGLCRELVEARAEAALARDDFVRMRALHADRAPRSNETAVDADTLDEDFSDAIPVLLDNEDTDEQTPLRQTATVRYSQRRSATDLGRRSFPE